MGKWVLDAIAPKPRRRADNLRCCIAVVGVVADGDEDSERRLRQLGLLHVASDADRPDALVDRARAALDAESDLDDPDPTEESPSGDGPIEPDGDGRRVLAAVWGPKGGPGRTTVCQPGIRGGRRGR